MSEIAKYVYVDDMSHVEKIKKGIERKIEKFGARWQGYSFWKHN